MSSNDRPRTLTSMVRDALAEHPDWDNEILIRQFPDHDSGKVRSVANQQRYVLRHAEAEDPPATPPQPDDPPQTRPSSDFALLREIATAAELCGISTVTDLVRRVRSAPPAQLDRVLAVLSWLDGGDGS